MVERLVSQCPAFDVFADVNGESLFTQQPPQEDSDFVLIRLNFNSEATAVHSLRTVAGDYLVGLNEAGGFGHDSVVLDNEVFDLSEGHEINTYNLFHRSSLGVQYGCLS